MDHGVNECILKFWYNPLLSENIEVEKSKPRLMPCIVLVSHSAQIKPFLESPKDLRIFIPQVDDFGLGLLKASFQGGFEIG